MTKIALVGNPNCGKTSLFNVLTGDTQRVGNWPGVTVEKKTGTVFIRDQAIQITDLPGIYSLVCSSEHSSADEKITAQHVAFGDDAIILNVIDACKLERHLYLTSQLLELGKPVIVALNMMDLAKNENITLDIGALANLLHCPVIPIQAHREIGIKELKEALLKPQYPVPLSLMIPEFIYTDIDSLEKELSGNFPKKLANYLAFRITEGDTFLPVVVSSENTRAIAADADILLADARYKAINNIVGRIQKKAKDASESVTAKLDRLFLHRFWSLPIFLFVMYTMFLFAINVGGVFQDFFEMGSDAVFVQGVAEVLKNSHAPDWLIALCAYGIGRGINTTLSFIPVIAAMFFFLSLLETSGYMARAAFIVDKVMRLLGLPGKSFVPMIVGFGCNVPAIMGTRILESEKDRLLTILMSPFMSCSARLAIYAVFISAFFPTGGQNIVFSLYMIGIVMALLTGLLLRKTYFKGEVSPLIIELPTYHRPSFKRLFRETYIRLKFFITRAGKVIIPLCTILGVLNALSMHGLTPNLEASSSSLLSQVGRLLTPLFSPMGISAENWPATVGLLTGMLAKEVVIGTLNSLYSSLAHPILATASTFHFWDALYQAIQSIPNNFIALKQALFHPIEASMSSDKLSASAYGVMAHFFGSARAAYAYLLFILLYIPCVSTMGAIKQEANRKWMWFSILWSLSLAYALAVGFYQIATVYQHPQQTVFWVSGLLLVCGGIVFSLRFLTMQSTAIPSKEVGKACC